MTDNIEQRANGLLPCPFCGDDRAAVYYDDIRLFAYVTCLGDFPKRSDSCGWMATSSKGDIATAKKEAMRRWNDHAAALESFLARRMGEAK